MQGRIERRGSCWLFRYDTYVIVDGKRVRKQVAKKLATFSDKYHSKKDVEPLAEAILAGREEQSGMTVTNFLENVYLPHCRETLRPSTAKGYADLLRLILPHLDARQLVREFRTVDADRLLRAVADEKQRAHTVHKNLKSVLSGAFRFAKRSGIINGENPVRDCSIPRGKPAGAARVYTLDEVKGILSVLPEPARTLVLVAALTGLRLSEVKGLRWEDFTGDELRIARGVWQGKVSETKTLASKAAVPVLSIVAEALEAHRARTTGGGGHGYIFAGATGKPLRVENVLGRVIRPALERANLQWRGWHAFRRGLATNLYSLGAPDKVIQGILRHSNLAVTLQYYVKPVAADSHAAMRKLGSAFESARLSA